MFETLTKHFTKYICQNDGESLANLFSKDGCYHDYIYGNFRGRKNISIMLSDYFHRDGEDFFWEMYDHALENNLGYVKYRFSFISKIPDYKGRKVVIPGIGCFEFENEFIKNYSEAVNGGLAMVQLGVNPLKMEKVFLKWLKRSINDDPNLSEIKNEEK